MYGVMLRRMLDGIYVQVIFDIDALGVQHEQAPIDLHRG